MDKKELRDFIVEHIEINENDTLTDVSQIGDEWKKAGRFVKGAVSKAMDPNRRLAKLQYKAAKQTHKFGTRALKHSQASQVHGLRAQKAGIAHKAWQDAQTLPEDYYTSLGYQASGASDMETAKPSTQFQQIHKGIAGVKNLTKIKKLQSAAKFKGEKEGYKDTYALRNYIDKG